jgi:hypothetical protein
VLLQRRSGIAEQLKQSDQREKYIKYDNREKKGRGSGASEIALKR